MRCISYLIVIVIANQPGLVRLNMFNIRLLTEYVGVLMDEQLGFSTMQKRVELLDYQTRHYDGGEIVEQVAKRLARKISPVVKDMREVQDKPMYFANLPENFMETVCYATYTCKESMDDGGIFQSNMKLEEVCSSVGACSSSKSWKISSKVMQIINAYFEKHPFMEKQYFMTQNRIFTFFKRKDDFSCAAVKSRPRPKSWFLQASSPKKMHVVVLLDTSYSMSHTHNARTLLKNAINAVEYFLQSALSTTKIDVVAFNDSIAIFRGCEKFSHFRQEFRSNHSLLNIHFLSDLTAGGQSYFADGFQTAFRLLTDETNNAPADRNDMAILLISDGGASETFNNRTNEIYQAISNGNKVLNNAVRIFTYGVGRSEVNMDLLKSIARQEFQEATGQNVKQDFSKTVGGLAFRIDEPDRLGSLLQSFYYHLDEDHLINTPVLSPPFYDSDTASIKVTSVVHMYKNRTDFDAILAADISIDKLMKDDLYLDNYKQSYFFVIGKDGQVLFHPAMSNFDHVRYEFDLPDIEQLEPFHGVHDLITTMVLGDVGQSPVSLKQKLLSEDMKNQVNYTYYWHPITGTDFTLCFVKEINDHAVIITPEYAISGCLDTGVVLPASSCKDSGTIAAKFHYHKLNEDRNIGICDYFGKASTINGSVVKFAPRSYKSSLSDIDSIETTAKIKAYTSFFNNVLNATSFPASKYMLDDDKYSQSIHDTLQDGVVADVLWTAFVDDFWMKTPQSCIVRRFVATNSGVMRFFPGTRLPSNYDPSKREWYRSAVSHHTLTAISTPYEDAAGAGTIITLSRAINKPISDVRHFNNKVMAVMGLDMHSSCLETSIIRLYPLCTNEWLCSIIDSDGNVIHQINQRDNHNDVKEKSALPDHLISENGDLAQLLLRQGAMIKVRCFELARGKLKVSYKILRRTRLNTMSSRNACGRYVLEQIPQSNAFFVARERHESCYYKTCMGDNTDCTSDRECIYTDAWPNSQCECPCTMKIDTDPCSLRGQLNDTMMCSTTHDNIQSSYCPTQHMDRCYSSSPCRNMSGPVECAQQEGCVWCITSQKEPFCANIQQCFEKSYSGRNLGHNNTCHASYPSSSSVSSTIIALTTAFGVTALIILFVALVYYTMFYRQNESYRFPKSTDNFTDIVKDDGDVITTVTWNQIKADENAGSSRNLLQHRKVGSSQIMQGLDNNNTRMTSSERIAAEKESSDTFHGGNFHQHTQPRKRTRNIDEKKVAKPKSPSTNAEVTSRPYFTTAQTETPHKRQKNHEFSRAVTDETVKSNKFTHAKESSAVTKLLQSVLKKRTGKGHDIQSSNDIYMDNFSTSLDNVPSYFNMFAEPANKEGDIPIIQSDTSDTESMKIMSSV